MVIADYFCISFSMCKSGDKSKKMEKNCGSAIALGLSYTREIICLREESYTKMTNLYKIPNNVIEICDFIDEDIAFNQENQEEIRMVVPYYFSSYIISIMGG